MARNEYSDEVRAQVLAALAEGLSMVEAAKRYRVPVGTVKSWKSRQDAAPVALVATGDREEVGRLLIGFLKSSIRTLQVQVEQFGDKAWLQSQSASELASLFGTVTDRAFRLLEALEAGAEAEQEPEPPGGVP